MNNNNYCVIMSGGIGSRFWPFSREAKPKQFLDFFGTGRSLLQLTVDRFKKILPIENIYIVTNEAYAELTKQEIPELKSSQVLLEPLRRNTAPCIAYAAYHIKKMNPDANIVVAPADHLILKEDEFASVIKQALEFVSRNPILLTLGIKPNRPETGYGYIQIDEDKVDGINKVKVFTEKPNYELAKIFYESGEFLWNSGLFIWNVDTILRAFHDYLPEISNVFDQGVDIYCTPEEQGFINEQYAYCPNISIDYGIMEKASNVCVLGADFGWSDLGTWGSLHDISEKDEEANVTLKCETMFFDSSENIVAMPEGKLAVIQGLHDYIVAESDGILLICKKSDEQSIKQFVADTKLKYNDRYI
ncbi:mannose-1-phosphate guanylyltransferase [Dysgonomonas macrotermitis]|uniref:mannose-1-phosphate guanylyltransferase n=1 Tax=Dysgonomonas macrotermitis TaxID=1346286 RepID=A0A1M4Y1V6_9BACT|nr:mannose-1-phosphate guanylyltransferase [Dysgonomonas macrotermitis]SHE99824.1 mannose-1-phosphate guanylyltransferase [Dysgonomonas macrotermitis]